METALRPGDRWWFVYGTRDSAATRTLRARAQFIARRLFGGDSSRVRADRDIGERELGLGHLFLIGGPRQNEWTRRLEGTLPVRFTTRGFRWFGRAYEEPGDVIHLAYPHPLAPRRFLMLVASNSVAAAARRGGGFYFGGEDWRIYRDGELMRSGSFSQSPDHPWRYDAALDHDLEGERERFEAGLTREAKGSLVVRAPPGMTGVASVRAAGESVLARVDRLGLAPPASGPITLTLYPSLELKGELCRDTRPEHLDAQGHPHAALPAGRNELDLWSVAASRLRRSSGSADSRFLEPAAVWLAGRFGGETLEQAIQRLYVGGLLPTAREAATVSARFRSPLIWTPARALLARAVHECARRARGRSGLAALLAADPPGSLDSLCQRAGADPRAVDRRFALLGDSLARAGARHLNARRPKLWRPADGFQRGICLAHAVSLERGYLSEDNVRQLEALALLGANWISLTPFGYLPSLETPEIHPSSDGGLDGESDEAVCEASARARALGLRVWLKPHLWTRGWIGELKFSPSGWDRFFDQYRAFLIHYALLAEREGMDGLVVGHELPSATLAFPDRWQSLIAEVRRVYTGTLTYGAHWQQEVDGIGFWDALDVVGVSFYAPLAPRPTRSVAQLEAGAERALDRIRSVAVRTHRPVLLLEVGYAPHRDAPVKPWEEQPGAPDLEAQRSCYEALARAVGPEDWIAGVFWWKWFTTDRIGGPNDASFSPRGKPAEGVLRRAFRDWTARAVCAPSR
jgi:hypothetical protein